MKFSDDEIELFTGLENKNDEYLSRLDPMNYRTNKVDNNEGILMEFFIFLTLLLTSCSTLPSHELEDCEDSLVHFYRSHYQPVPFEDIKEVCTREVNNKRMIEREMNRR